MMTRRGWLWITLALGCVSFVAIATLVSPAFSFLGDVNLDGVVGQVDPASVGQRPGRDSFTDPGWSYDYDLDLDDHVDVADLAIAGRSYGSTRNPHFARPLANRSTSVATTRKAALPSFDCVKISMKLNR